MSPADNISASSARFRAGRINRRIKRWSSSTRRVMYFLVPLVTACALFGGLEAIQARRRITRVSQDLAGPAAPTVLAGCSFLGGTVLLFSNAMPESGVRLQLASAVLRLPIIEASHFLGNVVGVFLLLLSSQLQRRSHAAWLIALLLLLVGRMAQLLNASNGRRLCSCCCFSLGGHPGCGQYRSPPHSR
jgi:lysylphosphatidylglycerol synthetase-like protein (DUF2156 family)